MNAPKKIWVDPEKEGAIWPCHNGIEYIRADLVDGLVEALEGLQEWVNGTAYDKARAALKALESAEIGRGME